MFGILYKSTKFQKSNPRLSSLIRITGMPSIYNYIFIHFAALAYYNLHQSQLIWNDINKMHINCNRHQFHTNDDCYGYYNNNYDRIINKLFCKDYFVQISVTVVLIGPDCYRAYNIL